MANVKYFKTDRRKYYRITHGTESPSMLRRLFTWVFNYGFHCVMAYRFGAWAGRVYKANRFLGLPFKLIHLVLSCWMKMFYHMSLEDGSFGPGLYIGHIGTIYIGPTTIGANCSLTHNVTIGIGQTEGAVGLPTIGDNVWIGTGAVISGPIQIGNGVTIAPGCILSRSVPDGCLVAGNPGRVVLREYDNRRLFGYLYEQAINGLHRGDGSVLERDPDTDSPRSDTTSDQQRQ
ncbi:MAG: serine acetyltransferase [Candidatus Zixiibacteriota bacterium]